MLKVKRQILIIDDNDIFCDSVTDLLADDQTDVLTAHTGRDGLKICSERKIDVVILDQKLPDTQGVNLCPSILKHNEQTKIIFVTASSEHALQAFDVAAADYLTKPVRSQRLQLALHKAAAQLAAAGQHAAPAPTTSAAPASLLLQERDQSQRLPLAEILYARAEQKYVTLRTCSGGELLWDGSLSQLEDQHPQHFVRIHRNTLAQRQAMRQLKLCPQSDGSEGWLLQLESCTEWLPVSRRQLPIVRQALQNL